MNQPDQSWWARARYARSQLETQLLNHPDVTLIDIGIDPQRISTTPVLRVHVRRRDPAALPLPEEVDGIPVRIISGDYQPQFGDS